MKLFKNVFSPTSALSSAPMPEADYRSASKKLTFSSKMNRDVLERRVSDLAESSNVPTAYVWEDAIINSLLPSDERARRYTVKVLYGRQYDLETGAQQSYGIREALSEIFCEAEEASNELKLLETLRPLVKYANKTLRRHYVKLDPATTKGLFPESHDLSWLLKSACAGIDQRRGASAFAGLGVETLERTIAPRLEAGEGEVDEATFFLLDVWEAVDAKFAFRFLSRLLDLVEPWEDTANDRIEFQAVCETSMAEWACAEAEAAERKVKAKESALLTEYRLADGYCLLAPRGWRELNPQDAASAKFVGVYSIRYGERYDAPTFIVYFNKPIGELTSAEFAQVEEEIEKRWPELAKVKADEVEIARNPDGGIANAAAAAAAPAAGLFPIYMRGEYPLGERPPYGAEIVKKEQLRGKEG